MKNSKTSFIHIKVLLSLDALYRRMMGAVFRNLNKKSLTDCLYLLTICFNGATKNRNLTISS